MRSGAKRWDCGLQALESRVMLAGGGAAAGGILASVVHGSLIIKGDSAGNSISIDAAGLPAGHLRVRSENGTINGGDASAEFSGVTRDVLVDLGGGDDAVALLKARIAGNLTIRSGAGDDRVNLRGVRVGGSTQIQTALGNDVITSAASVFAGKFGLSAGRGDDAIDMGNSVFKGASAIDAGGGQTPRIGHVVTRRFDFGDGAQGWTGGFADYQGGNVAEFRFASGVRTLPKELGTGTGFLLRSMNRSDDVFMYLTRQLGRADGLLPNQTYQVSFAIRFGSNAPTGAVGVGGAPGESVYLKAGASATRPVSAPDAGGFVDLNIDHGQQSGGGSAASVAGNIANGRESVDGKFVSLKRSHVHTAIVKTDAHGNLHLVVGTDSGYEGLTTLYYQQIDVRLVAVAQANQEKPPVAHSGGGGDVHPV